MQIIAEQKLTEFAQRHSTARSALLRWFKLMEQEDFGSESAAQWLIDLLNLLAGIVHQNEDLNRVVVTETEYQQLLAVLDDLIHGVGDDENHPLSAAMTLVGVLIKAYEDAHFPKLADLYPELVKQAPDKRIGASSDTISALPGQIETDFVIVFFSIGCLLWKGGKAEAALSAYDLAVRVESL